MFRIQVPGTPIGGEDRRTADWIAQVAAACRLHEVDATFGEVSLTFNLAQGRRVDLDNLVRPAMSGMQKAGLLRRGFVGLDRFSASKVFGEDERLIIESRSQDPSFAPDLRVTLTPRPKNDQWRPWQRDLVDRIGRAWRCDPVDTPVFVQVQVDTQSSLVDLMKPALDCLEPYLGRDPAGRSEFYPNDHLVEWIAFSRSPGEGTIAVGRLPSLER